MKACALLVLVLAGCGGAASSAAKSSAPMSNRVLHTCAEAAVGLERATRGLRTPETRRPSTDRRSARSKDRRVLRRRVPLAETSVFERMQGLCNDENWPTAAIDCFAALRTTQEPEDLGACIRKLHEGSRNRVFAQLDGSALAIVDARLASLQVGIAECDRFVATVRSVLGCEGMPLDTRVQLGAETADFWSLPTRLPADAQRRMAAVCGQSLAVLQQQATGVGCMP